VDVDARAVAVDLARLEHPVAVQVQGDVVGPEPYGGERAAEIRGQGGIGHDGGAAGEFAAAPVAGAGYIRHPEPHDRQ
jgi:hypothetical protein